MPKLKQSIKQIATKNGIYLGIAISILVLVAYSVDWDMFFKWWFAGFKFFILIGFAVTATIQAKKVNQKEFSFRDAFTSYFITVALGLAIYTVLNYVLFDLISPQAGHYLTEKSNEILKSTQGKDFHKIREDQFSAANQLKGYILNLGLYLVPGVIVALFFKKKKPIIV